MIEGLVESTRQAPNGQASPFVVLGQLFVPRLDHFGVFDAFLALDLGMEEAPQIVGEADGLRDAFAGLAGGPGFTLIEAHFLMAEQLSLMVDA